MAISELPSSTVRAIGAAQALTDSVSLVKELIDNAIDAHATSVLIEIHVNTLDLIHVRDNGHGIPPADRALVARPHCTSKLAGIDDLRTIGGISLGFRGEAMASVAELSGSLTICTRVDGEPVAASLKISARGEILAEEKASLPVGTMVKVTDFLQTHPVRRQQGLKNAAKTLKKIKQMLQAYAFARPKVRFSLRALKAKNDKLGWTYAPKPDGALEDAAFKLVGAACTSQCERTTVEKGGFTLHALLPRADAETSKVSGIGAFVSVDGRPMAAARGPLRQIVKQYHESLKKANPAFHGSANPFMYLEISCAVGSYDVNVEPGKDDVLFEDPEHVMAITKELFDSFYTAALRPDKPVDDDSKTHKQVYSQRETPQQELSSSITNDPPTSLSEVELLPQLNEDRQTENNHPLRSNMYDDDDDDYDLFAAATFNDDSVSDTEEFRQLRKDTSLSNPWVIAKMNAAVGESQYRSGEAPFIDLEKPVLPTPRCSSPLLQGAGFNPSAHVPDVRVTRDGRIVNLQTFATPISPRMQGVPPHQKSVERVLRPRDSRIDESALSEYESSAELRRSGPFSPQKQTSWNSINKPFVQPFKQNAERDKVWFDHLPPKGQKRRLPNKKALRSSNTDINSLPGSTTHRDVPEGIHPLTPPERNRDGRDYFTSLCRPGEGVAATLIEHRNYSDAQQHEGVQFNGDEYYDDSSNHMHKGFMPASKLAANLHDEFNLEDENSTVRLKRRTRSGKEVLRERSSNADYSQPAATSRQRKVSRTKSSLLPLERVPAGQVMHNVAVRISVRVEDLANRVAYLGADVLPYADHSFFTSASPADIDQLATKLQGLLAQDISDDETVPNFCEILPDVFASHRARLRGGEPVCA